MAAQPHTRICCVFGPFEVDTAAGELRKSGVRIRLSGQPFRILLALLDHPGELVTREQLRDEVWEGATFIDFEHGLNAAMNKLRRALSDSAENPRYIETHPGRGYRFIGTLQHRDPAPIPVVAESPLRENPTGRRRVRLGWWLTAIGACLVSLTAGWRLHNPSSAPPSWKLTRLTTDTGLSDSPAISRDGKLVAYSSDIGAEGQMDLYLKQVTGGQPIRLTMDGAGNTTPDFSPDNSRIVFESRRDGGGIYEIPAFGGQARLLARGGKSPRYSPDGSQVSYWVGTPAVDLWVPGGGAVWVIPVAGGPPRRVAPNLTNARWPIWSPDGKRLLFNGYGSTKHSDISAMDWWLADANGGEAI